MMAAISIQDFYKNKRVLVTGHTGFKGSWLCEWLLQIGAKVGGLSLSIPTQPSHFEILDLASRISHFECDVRDFNSLQRVVGEFQPEVIFHLAAQPLVRLSYDEPRETFETNIMGSVNLFEVVRKSPSVLSLVIVTSDKVYENVGWEFAYRETDALGGHDPYSASKGALEIVSKSYIRSYFSEGETARVATARAGNVIGGGDWAEDRIIPDCVRALKEMKTMVLRNPTAVRPWQHVLEPVGAYLLLGQELALKNSAVVGESFNFGPPYSSCRTVEDLTKGFSKSSGGPLFKVEPCDVSKKHEASYLRVNCDKAQARLGWAPRLSFDESIALTGAWYTAYLAGQSYMRGLTQKQIEEFRSKPQLLL